MRIVSVRAQRGLGLFGPRSALSLLVDPGASRGFAGRAPSAPELSAMWAELRRIPGDASLFDERPPRPRWGAMRDHRIDLLSAIATQLMRRYEAREPQVRALELDHQGLVRVVVLCDEHEIALLTWEHCCACLAHLLQPDAGGPPSETAKATEERRSELSRQHASLRGTARRLALNQLTLALVREAAHRGIPWLRLAIGSEFVQFGHGRLARYAHETVTDTTSALASGIAHDKAATNALLARVGLPTADSSVCASEDDAARVAQRLGFPVVVKPRDGSKGRDVFVRLTDEQQVRAAWRRVAAGGASGVLVERCVQGDDHRLLVIGGRLVAGARRMPAFVVGDGRCTVRQLVAALNSDPRRGRGYERVMEKVDLDHEAMLKLDEAGLTADSVPVPGRKVFLRGTANISRGGHADDVTDAMHPDNRELAERAADAIGLDVAGVDFLSPDIGRSWRENGAALVEVNSNPGLRPHWVADERRDVVGPLFERMFPPGVPARIPTVAVTGSFGKTTTCRMLARILRAVGHRTGLSCSLGSFVDDETVEPGDRAGGGPALRLLSDPRIGAAVFELARGGLLADGLGLEDCDVGAVLNVRENHLGVDGVRSLAQLARVKGLVAQAATRAAVLNADDPFCVEMAARVRARKLVWVGRDADTPLLGRHRAEGGAAVLVETRGQARVLSFREGARTLAELDLSSMPATLHGASPTRIDNAAFAAASAWALGVAPDLVEAGLRDFDASYAANPGRLNQYEGLPFRLLVDKLAGPPAWEATVDMVRALPDPGRRLCLLSVLGRRSDAHIASSARAAAPGFDHFVCVGWPDDDRPSGQVAELLRDALVQAGTGPDRIDVAINPIAALERAFAIARAGDVLLVAAPFGSEAQAHRAISERVRRLAAGAVNP